MGLLLMPSTEKGNKQGIIQINCWWFIECLKQNYIFSFQSHSMFGSVELDSLNPQRVDHVNIKMVTSLAGPQM